MKTVVILSDQKLHLRQGAAYSRIINYAKALTLNNNVEVYLCSFQLTESLNTHEQIGDNIYIVGKPKLTSKSLYFINKILYSVRSFVFLNKIRKYFVIAPTVWLIYPVNILNDTIALILIKIFNKQEIFCEKNELKIGIVLNLALPQEIAKLLVCYVLRLLEIFDALLNDRTLIFYDGVISISTRIEKWAKKRTKRIIRIPILVDCSKHQNEIIDRKGLNFNICFTGTISLKKEGLENFVTAISTIKNNVVLNIYGSGYKTEIKELYNLVEEYDLQEKVVFHGQKASEMIPMILSQHNLLILPRPKNIQTQYGFSTKLAEYMASGVPVLVTDVSDNALFIKDGLNGFIVSSNTPDVLSNKLNSIMSRNDLCIIGNKGRKTALKFFDYQKYSKQLNDFMFG